ncbi:MAG: hypoxanthine phosphoribosyltransferase, partial [Bacteroidetes bacterium]
MSDIIQLHDLQFAPFLSADRVQQRVSELASKLRESHTGKRPVFLVMLKGAFIFATDLIRQFPAEAEISFVRARSYLGTQSSRKVELVLGPEEEEIK